MNEQCEKEQSTVGFCLETNHLGYFLLHIQRERMN